MKNNKALAVLLIAAVCAFTLSPSIKAAADAIGERIRERIEDLENPLIDVLKSSSLTPTSELQQRIERAEDGLRDLKAALTGEPFDTIPSDEEITQDERVGEPAEEEIEEEAPAEEEELPDELADLAEDLDFDVSEMEDLDLPPELLEELSGQFRLHPLGKCIGILLSLCRRARILRYNQFLLDLVNAAYLP